MKRTKVLVLAWLFADLKTVKKREKTAVLSYSSLLQPILGLKYRFWYSRLQIYQERNPRK